MSGTGSYKRQCTVFASFRTLSKPPRRKPPLICLQLFLGPIEFPRPYVLIFRETFRIPRK